MNGNTIAGTVDNQPDLLARLQNVVRQLNRSDIRTVSALIAKAMGDQQAAMMAVRLLHWFPKAKKLGGWVYKSWRDWNAECNLSQAQVKRVHGKGLLETIGIERAIMKANGTPTVHYRLDENKLIQRLADFLKIVPIQITAWMWPEPTKQDSGNQPSQEAVSTQPIQPKQPDELSDNSPTHSAETAQSITDFDLQTLPQDVLQTQQQNLDPVVVDPVQGKKMQMLRSMGELGIGFVKSMELLEAYGAKRIEAVVQHTQTLKRHNPAGYAIRALTENWTIPSASQQDDYACSDGRAYITGTYAAFIEH